MFLIICMIVKRNVLRSFFTNLHIWLVLNLYIIERYNQPFSINNSCTKEEILKIFCFYLKSHISHQKETPLPPMFIEDVNLLPNSYMQMGRKITSWPCFGGKQILAGNPVLEISRFPWDPPRGARAE
jgi:hypothetical protein